MYVLSGEFGDIFPEISQKNRKSNFLNIYLYCGRVHRKYVTRLHLQLFTAVLCLFSNSSDVEPYCLKADPDPSFLSMRIWIRIQEAKPMRIKADPDPDHGQTFEAETRLNLIEANFHAPGSGSAFPIRYGSGSGSKTAK